MTSRTPRDSRLRLVRPRPVAAARQGTSRRSRPAPRPPEGTPPLAELARTARAGLAGAVRVARWAADEHGGTGGGGTGALGDDAVRRATEALRLAPQRVRADWDRARFVGLVELHGDTARPGWRLRAWERDDAAVLRGWVALFDAWSLARPAPAATEPAAVAEVVEAVPQLLSFLQLSAGPVRVSALLDMLRQRVAELRTERCEVPYGVVPAPNGAAPAAGPAPDPLRSPAPDPAADPPRRPGADGLPAQGPGPLAAAALPVPGGRDAAPADPGTAGDSSLETLLDWALGALASVGALVVLGGPSSGTSGGTSGGPQAAARAPDGPPAADRREAVLTPLGNWAVWVKLEQICVAAQSPAGNIEQPAADMLRGCANLTPGPARDEYRAWLAARPAVTAVTELLDAARGDDPLLRGLAFEALRVVGGPAEHAVRAVLDDPCLRPYALLWLAEHEGADPEDAVDALTREEAAWLWVDTAAAIADHGESPLLVRHLESAVRTTVPALLAEVRAAGHPRTVQVLVALAAAHPDPALAKAVRRAAFQLHVGGA
ncbi:hypothetical protein RKE29_24915 [Streptomyces sp. B1866]|uniref:hypothetical protein n=1 Tax=Streptomyces sp. B1866 TaxID=3075431 RepID=UPI002892837F|nr:hypothetical protein [Streptomyces sp. B1866]MDT3399839.1 hypothetical protein [Streptomyces sp. B1866]